MPYTPYRGPRIFKIYNGATVSDPAESIPLTELVDGDTVNYPDFSVLKELIAGIEARWSKATHK